MEFETSRRWLLQLGAAGVLTGFRGIVDAEATMPPGVCLPQTNHLVHVLRDAVVAQPLANYQPRFFAREALNVVREMVARLLGNVSPQVVTEIANWIDLTVSNAVEVRITAKSLTPAQRALAVQYYGKEEVEKLETFEPDQICRAGLAAVGSSTPGQLVEDPVENEAVGRLIGYLRKMAIDGYYASKEGLKDLNYRGNSFYAESPGCTH